MGWEKIVEIIGSLIPFAISLAESVGKRDAAIQALDAALAVARAQNDRDLAAKHGR